VLGRSRECLNQKSKGGGLFFEREQEREGGEEFLRFEKEKGWQLPYLFASRDRPAHGTRGQSTTPPRTVREVRRRSGAPAWTVRYSLQNIQYCHSPSRAARTVRVALTDGPLGADGQSGPSPQTIQPSFSFQLGIF
jgi:hypothetical protein